MQSGKAAAPPMSVTNSRHCIAALNPPIAPYHVIAENAACITAKLASDVRDGSTTDSCVAAIASYSITLSARESNLLGRNIDEVRLARAA